MKDSWDDNGVETQARILAFDQIATHDEAGGDSLPGAGTPPKAAPKPARKRGKRR